ncbi:hypothetical protein [Nonomuraea zeae]|uniref:Uncharacterized protein n=1 Tax=Nonomuraea zeae TaxID=1642303 RepID=A0A5S4G3X9_9ACTN|nr:hypothetical protein [Nonomuraea zeae]TMR27552.1 hypothetical protein ETD85_38785 [Nonomuraea zeae]
MEDAIDGWQTLHWALTGTGPSSVAGTGGPGGEPWYGGDLPDPPPSVTSVNPRTGRKPMSDDWRPRSADVLVLLIQAYLAYVPWLLEHVGGAW